ncbi:pseudouridine synthase [Clostridium thermobutyricum]|uniref:Pseudouridine synthase n=1 Tax=Clostridium thermobutyricum TaxID=29372 RepID=N9Y1M8_9CLOT|nr:pseudouridine synthase [Clostridium thermobutyricum]ENZ01707.1 pseudouridine synthase [Clostridium thermobutyricum]
MRINKLFSNYGICSRKQTNILIKEKRVLINGILAKEGQWVEESDEILLDGKKIKKADNIYLAFNKPRGIICSSSEDLNNNIIKFLNFNGYIFPIGRLDKESEGLILLTNDGDFANSLINSENYHPKEYIVKVNRNITDEFLNSMSKGVKILNTITRPCILKRISNDTFSIILTQGLNRQIRRMCLNFGYRVISLKRIRIVNILLDNLQEGEFRNLTDDEILTLKNFLFEKKNI